MACRCACGVIGKLPDLYAPLQWLVLSSPFSAMCYAHPYHKLADLQVMYRNTREKKKRSMLLGIIMGASAAITLEQPQGDLTQVPPICTWLACRAVGRQADQAGVGYHASAQDLADSCLLGASLGPHPVVTQQRPQDCCGMFDLCPWHHLPRSVPLLLAVVAERVRRAPHCISAGCHA